MDAWEAKYGEAWTDDRPECVICTEPIDGAPQPCRECRKLMHWSCSTMIGKSEYCEACVAEMRRELDAEDEPTEADTLENLGLVGAL